MIHRRFTLQSSLGQPIHGDLRLPEVHGPHPVVVVCHGFKGFKDWGFHPWLGERLAAAGLAAVHFNFSRNGVRAADGDIEDLDAFRKNTLSIERDDLDTVLDAVLAGRLDSSLDPSRLGLMGHSRGGGIALLGASERPEVKALATWAAVSHFDRIADEATLAEWRRTRRLRGRQLADGTDPSDGRSTSSTTSSEIAHGSTSSRPRGAFAPPWLVVHGTADETVPFAEAEELAGACRGPVRLAAVDGAGHTFAAVHPFAGPTSHLEAAAAATLEHFRAALGLTTAE